MSAPAPAESLTAAASVIAEGARTLGLVLPEGAERTLGRFLILLDKWNRVYNLTAIREPERMVTHHVLDAIAVLPALEALGLAPPSARVLDVGSGGGLPGIPLAIARPGWHVVLCEPNHKKSTFLVQAAAELALRNVEVAASRIEDYRPSQPFDLVISRAFSDLATFADVAASHVASAGAMVAMKGVVPEEEIAELPGTVAVAAMPALAVPGLDAMRHLIVMKRKDNG